MALVYCPNCRSANSSCQRRCWICEKSLAPAPANPSGRPLTYPQRMRLVRFAETVSGSDGEITSRIVYVKSMEDDRPVRDYWQALRDEQMLKLRRIYAGTATALSVLLAATLFGLATPAPAPAPLRLAPPVLHVAAPDNPLAHTILPPPRLAITASYPAFATPQAYSRPVAPIYYQAGQSAPQAM